MKTNLSKQINHLFQQIKRTRKPSKLTLMVLAGLASLMIFSGTYAWFTSADAKKNSFLGTHLTAEIDEIFTPTDKWQPNQDVVKEVRVTNTGETPALVRLSLYEFFLSFQVNVADLTGNLKTVDAPIQPVVDAKETTTWQPAADGGGTYTRDGHHYVANQVILSDPETGTDKYEHGGTSRDDTALTYITLNFSDAFKETSSGATNYWIYEDGYFYYSEILQPGESSEPLLDSLSLKATLPNQYKGALYKLKIYMDAHDTTASLKEEWALTAGGQVEQMLEGKLTR